MKRVQIFILLSILTVPLLGAVQIKYEYWFDNDRSSLYSGAIDSTSFELVVETEGLEVGLHTVNVQLTDTSGLPIPVVTRYFIKAFFETEVKEVNFWIDDKRTAINNLNSLDGIIEIETEDIDYGLHFIHSQIIGKTGFPTSVATSAFIKAFYPAEKKEISYWFDNDRSLNRKLDSTDGIIEVKTDDMDYGFHSIHLQVVDSTGIATTVSTRYFIKSYASTQVKNVCYWFDCDESTVHTLNTYDDIVEIPADSLLNGFHSIHVRTTDNMGVPSSVVTKYFIKLDTDVSKARMFYSVDNGQTVEVTKNLENGVCYLDLDMSNLTDGLHRLVYYLSNEEEVTTNIRTSLFWKNPMEDAPVAEYSYWINDNSDTTFVQNTDYSNPFNLDVLIPVESQPFRSSYFSFFVEDGKPKVYAKNDFHIHVKNAYGYTDQDMDSYTDINVSYTIDSLIHLESGDVKTNDVPDANKILWYEFDASQNDSVFLRLDAKATLQLFSPTGVELLYVDSADVLKRNALAVSDNGRYYVAVHDVTSVVDDITIEYNRIDAFGLPHIEGISAPDSLDMVLGSVINMFDVVTLLPSEANDKSISLTSDNMEIVKILESGNEMIGATTGVTIITVQSNDNPNVIKTIKVRVKEPVIKFIYDGRYISFGDIDGTIHFTLDGTEPTVQSDIYNRKIDTKGLCDVNALVVNNGYASSVQSCTLDSYYDGAVAYTGKNGVLAKAFEWCGSGGVENLKIEGLLDSIDFATIRNLGGLRLLDLSESSIMGNVLQDSILCGSSVLSVEFPSTILEVGNGLFYGCDNLASIVWNSTTVLTQDVLGGIDNPNFLLFVKDISQSVQSGIANVVVNGMAQRITLTDNILPDGTRGPANFYCPRSFRVQNEITYTHTYTQRTLIGDCGGWETLTLPFDVQKIMHSEKGEIVPFKVSAFGRRQFWLCTLTDSGFVDADTIHANKPYLIAMPNNPEYSPIYCLDGEVTFSSRKIVVPATEFDTCIYANSSFVPSLECKETSSSIYALNVGEERWTYAAGSVFDSNYRDVYPFEAYRMSTSHAIQRMPVANDMNPGTTRVLIPGVDRVSSMKYDLKGVPLGDDNPRGLYIQDGKKWFRK